MATDGRGVADYELLELALTFAIPRRDVKPLAKALLAEFGSLSGVLTAPAAALGKIDGLGQSSIVFLQTVHQLSLRARREGVAGKPTLANRIALMDYLYTLFEGKTREEFHVLYVDAKLHLLKDETLFTGTLTSTTAAPRDIIKRALEVNAAGLIIAHNHPSGAPHPSADDITFTQALAEACPALGLTLHDHIIIGQNKHYSFKGAGTV